MRLLDAIWFRFLETAIRVREEERGDSMVNWVVLAVGLAVAAAAIVALLRPALETAAHKIVSVLSG
jgi:uncharacterized protein involved in exopolysaccharide biosynthesis